MKYTFLLVNVGGQLLSLAQRIKQEGYTIYMYVYPEMREHGLQTGVGILADKEMVTDYYEILNKIPKEELIILVDDNGKGHEFDFLRKQGYMVVNGSAFAEKIEYDRSIGTQLMQKIGLAVPQTHSFDSIEKAIGFAEKQKEDIRFVFKPDGEDFAGSSRTYTAKNLRDLIDYMKFTKSEIDSHKITMESFDLQEFIEGEEADFSAYFDGDKFMVGSTALDIEEKKSGDGNKGSATGCMGNIILYVNKSRYFDEYIKKLEPILKKMGYVGQISINNIFSHKDGKPYGLEFTPRMGWDAQTTEMAILKSAGRNISDFYIALATKKRFDFPYNRVGTGIRIYTSSVDADHTAIKGRFMSFSPKVKENLWFYNTSYTNDMYIIENNPVMVVNYADTSLQKSIDGAYEVLKNVNVPDIYYRMEIGKRAETVIRFLKKYQWL